MVEIATHSLRSGQALDSDAKGVARRLLAMTEDKQAIVLTQGIPRFARNDRLAKPPQYAHDLLVVAVAK